MAISAAGVPKLDSTTDSVTVSGTVTITPSGTQTVAGNKTNNNAAPGATNVGVLPAVATAASPAYTEGDQVAESVDLTGRQRIRGTLTNNTAAPVADGLMTLSALANAAAPTFTEGDLVLDSVDLNGNRRVIGTKLNNNAAPSTQLGVIPAVANAANPTWVEGNQVVLSETLAGYLRVINNINVGHNQTNYFMALPILTTATDTLMSLTGYKGGAGVAATTTPAVVTAGKTYRITSMTLTYVATGTAGSAKFIIRANPVGVVFIPSLVVVAIHIIGGPAVVAGDTEVLSIAFPDGLEFPAGTGIGVSMFGLSAIQAAAVAGYGHIVIYGYEY